MTSKLVPSTFNLIRKYIQALLLLLFFTNIGTSSLAQSTTSTNSLVPPSPTTAALLKYAEIPVSKYTGVPDISIPIYTVKSGALTLPISLSYHASGIKVADEASWVGLGWSLNCGGVIGRSIRGGDDFSITSSGYPSSPVLPTLVNSIVETNLAAGLAYPSQSAFLQLFRGVFDSEPDLFYFNFNGYSGKFYINRQNLSGEVIATQLDQKSNLKIQVLFLDQRFVITDGNGIKYYFGTKEYSYSEGQQTEVDNTYFPMGQYQMTGGCTDIKHISSWYLDSVAAPSGDRIQLQYIPASSFGDCSGIRSQTTGDETLYYKTSTSAPYAAVDNVIGAYVFQNLSRSVSEEVQLSGVTFNGGHVNFYTSSRNDVEGYQYDPQKLDSIVISGNNNPVPLRTVRLQNSYFISPASTELGRLRLDQVSVDSKPYSFVYNEAVQLPNKRSLAVDHWGLYNGAYANTQLIPQNVFGTDEVFMPNGANREADSVSSQAAILQEIHYPTGGYTKFDYELNDFRDSVPIRQPYEYDLAANQNYYGNSSLSAPFLTHDFYVPQQTTLTVTGAAFSNLHCDQYSDDVPSQGDSFGLVVPIPDSGAVGYPDLQTYLDNGAPTAHLDYDGCVSGSFGVSKQTSVLVNPGWYRLIAEANYDQTGADVSVNFSKIIGYKSSVGGAGLRVKRITDIDAENNSMVHKYVYRFSNSPTLSTGTLLTVPCYKAWEQIPQISLVMPSFMGVWYVLKSSSVVPLSTSAQGAFVGYDEVTELFGENGENGKKVSSFMNSGYGGQFNIPPSENISNGLLMQELTYKSSGDLIRKVENSYNEYAPARQSLDGTVYFTTPFLYGLPQDPSYYSGADYDGGQFVPPEDLAFCYFIGGYTIYCSWWQLLNTTITDYTPWGNHVESMAYAYNTLTKQVATETKTMSDNTLMITSNKYATDYGSSAGSIYTAMVTANMLNAPIETQTWHQVGTNQFLLGSTATQYNLFANNKFISPYRIYQSNFQIPIPASAVTQSFPYSNLLFNASYFDLKKEFDYDNYGNPVKITSESQKNTSYQWAYNHEYPVAECKNALNTEFYYEGYEESTASGVTTGTAHTGHKYTTDAAVSWTLPNGRAYLISYWYSDGTLWHYAAPQAFTGTFTMQSASGYDDVRIYPADAQMTTYTYDPLIGMTSATDAKGQTTYYEYDSLQRLINVKDQYGNVLKHTDYHYQGQ
jgi:YD repeat-containing protein